MLKALIFDVDGTLAETEELHRHAFNQTFAETGLGWHWTQDDYTWLLRTTGGKERMRRYRIEIGAETPSDEVIAALHERKTLRYAELVRSGALLLRPGIRDLVAWGRAAGLRLAVATTTNRPNVDALCEACWGLSADRVFDVVAAGDEVARKKPAPDVYNLALERMGLKAGHAIAFEDSRNGLLAAKSAGLAALVVPSAYTVREDFGEADWLSDDLTWANLPVILRSSLRPGADPMRGHARSVSPEPAVSGPPS